MKGVLVLLLAMGAGSLDAQVPGPPITEEGPSGTLSLGGTVGLSFGTGAIPLGQGASMTARRNDRSLRLSLNRAGNLKETVTMNALAVAFGAHSGSGQPHLSGFAGPALVWGRDDLEPDESPGSRSYVTAGLAAEGTALFGSRVQVGLGIWGNLNPRFSTFGAGPRLHIRLN